MYVPAVVVEACTRYVLFVEEVDPELRVRTQQTPNPGKSFRFELKDLFFVELLPSAQDPLAVPPVFYI